MRIAAWQVVAWRFWHLTRSWPTFKNFAISWRTSASGKTLRERTVAPRKATQRRANADAFLPCSYQLHIDYEASAVGGCRRLPLQRLAEVGRSFSSMYGSLRPAASIALPN